MNLEGKVLVAKMRGRTTATSSLESIGDMCSGRGKVTTIPCHWGIVPNFAKNIQIYQKSSEDLLEVF
jgi:hypothetical protein